VDNQYLDGLMRPKSIAVLGASSDPTKIGHSVIKNIIEGGYEGKIYPINLKSEEILGIKCYKSLLDVPGEIDAAVIITTASKAVVFNLRAVIG